MKMKKIPMRKCVSCGEQKEKKELLRIVIKKEEGIVLDVSGKKNGRGAYICQNRECLAMAIKNKGLERSFKMPIPKDVYETLTKEMEQLETR